MDPDATSHTVIEQMKSYYDARAGEYDEWFYRRGRYDHGPAATANWQREVSAVDKALADFNMNGHILELAPGTGIWTQKLATRAKTVTAVDASPEMLRINQLKVASDNVEYVKADLFTWRPSIQYDGVFFGFWISHVPLDRLDTFLETVATSLRPGGKIFFGDSRPDQTMSAQNHKLPEKGSQIMSRLLNDGRSFDVVKNFFEPGALGRKFAKAGLDVVVKETDGYFIYGAGIQSSL